MSKEGKTIISKVLLKDPDDWKALHGQYPVGPVVVRLENRDTVWGESNDETPEEEGEWILYSEDIKVAEFDHRQGKWEILPPYPLYDYSPLTKKGTLDKGTHVTHWRPLKDGELQSWQNRLKPINNYKKLKIEVDPEHEEAVYRTLVNAAGYIAEVEGDRIYDMDKGTGARLFYETLCDLQAAMDDHGSVTRDIPRILSGALADLMVLQEAFGKTMHDSWSTMNKQAKCTCVQLLEYTKDRLDEIIESIDGYVEWGKNNMTEDEMIEYITQREKHMKGDTNKDAVDK